MSDKNLMTLGAMALVMVLVSWCVGAESPTVHFKFNKGQLLIADLDPGRVHAITIADKGEEKVKLVRDRSSFLVESLHHYPAANKEVNDLIRRCLGVRCAAKASEDPSNHAELGVDGGEESHVVRFFGADGKELVGLVVGKNVEGGGGVHVRLASSDTVFRSEESVSVRSEGMDYVDKEIIAPPRDDIEQVVVKIGGEEYTINSPEKGKVELQGIPEGKKQKGTEPDGVLGAATYFNFSDFKSESAAKDLQFDSTYTITLRDQSSYRFEIAKQHDEKGDEKGEDKYFVRASARYLGPDQVTITKTESDEELKKKEAMIKASKAVEEFNQKHQSWVYEISSWKGQSMQKPFADLIEDAVDRPDEIEASHILIAYQGASRAEGVTRTKEEARQKAEALLAEVQADPSRFAELAKENSDGPSKTEGGALASFKFDAMAKPFSEAAFALEVDGLSDVVETEFGFHIIWRTR